MKNYKTDINGNLQLELGPNTIQTIPQGHHLYDKALAEVEAGESSIEEYDPAPALAEEERVAALEELAVTDWMVIRELEGGKSIPGPIKARRQAARLKANRS